MTFHWGQRPLALLFAEALGESLLAGSVVAQSVAAAARLRVRQHPIMYKFEERVGAVLFLFCAAIMAGIAYWYPWYLCTYHSAPDDRYGFAMIAALPFWFAAPGIAGWAAARLFRAVRRERCTVANSAFAIFGGLMGVIGFSPALMLVGRLMF